MPGGQKRDRRGDKRRRLMTERGTPALILPDEMKRLVARISAYHARGMTVTRMGDLSGVADSIVMNLINGTRGSREVKGARRSTYEALMTMPFEVTGLGARTCPVGSRRRLQAMCLEGYGIRYLAAELDKDKSALGKMIDGTKSRDYIYWTTHQKIDALYRKLDTVKIEDMGFTAYQLGRARAAAGRHGYIPRMCWDDDTIDDPHAFPEWTGACGTVRGWRIHLDQDIQLKTIKHGNGKFKRTVLCSPCREARASFGSGSVEAFDRDEMMELFDLGKSAVEVSAELGIHEWTLRRVRKEIMDAAPDIGS